VLVDRYVYACYSSHFNYLYKSAAGLTLPLLVTLIRADYAHHAIPADYLAVPAHLLY